MQRSPARTRNLPSWRRTGSFTSFCGYCWNMIGLKSGVTPGSGASRNLHGCSGARQLPALTSEDLRSRLMPVEVESPSL